MDDAFSPPPRVHRSGLAQSGAPSGRRTASGEEPLIRNLVSVGSLGVVTLGAHRGFDRLLDVIALYAETGDIIGIE